MKDLVCYFLKNIFSHDYYLDLFDLVSLTEQESKTMEKVKLDPWLLLVCRVDIPVCPFLNCLVNGTQALKSSKLEVHNVLV